MDAKTLIEQKGGAAELARILGLPKESGTQTVHNWKTRGIPSEIILDFPEVFKGLTRPKRKQAV